MRQKACAVLAIAFLVILSFSSLGLPAANTPVPTVPSYHQTAAAEPAASNSESSFLKHAFFPKETRLEDTQPLSGVASVGIASYGSGNNVI